MAVEDKEVKEFEDNFKKKIFDDEIPTIISSQSEVFETTKILRKNLGLDINLPNIGITLNNKLILLQHEFEAAGISMYSRKFEDYGELKLNGVGSPFVGESVILDLCECVEKGIADTVHYREIISSIAEKKLKEKHIVENDGLIRKLFTKIKGIFTSKEQENMLITQEEIQAINQPLSDYKEMDYQLWNYNLSDNIISSLTKRIRQEKYAAFMVPKLLEESVIPDLQKLGLDHLIPELQETLVQEYKKDLPDPEIYQISEKDMYLLVPDFNRETKHNRNISIDEWRSYIQTTIDKSKERIKKSIGENGITLKDFSSIDKEVGALDRQRVATNIAQGQEIEKERNSEEASELKEDEEQKEESI